MTSTAMRTEHRIPVVVAAVTALALYAFLPPSLEFLPRWLIPSVGLVVLIPLVLFNPSRLNRETTWSRWISLGFTIGLAAVNQVYIALIVKALITGSIDGP